MRWSKHLVGQPGALICWPLRAIFPGTFLQVPHTSQVGRNSRYRQLAHTRGGQCILIADTEGEKPSNSGQALDQTPRQEWGQLFYHSP